MSSLEQQLSTTAPARPSESLSDASGDTIQSLKTERDRLMEENRRLRATQADVLVKDHMSLLQKHMALVRTHVDLVLKLEEDRDAYKNMIEKHMALVRHFKDRVDRLERENNEFLQKKNESVAEAKKKWNLAQLREKLEGLKTDDSERDDPVESVGNEPQSADVVNAGSKK